MPSVHVSEHSDLPPEVVLAAARDFSPRRARMWPDVHVVHLEVHEFGEGYAEVTEGNPWPIGYVWERLRYDWSEPHALRGTVMASNLFKPGSTWELWATPEDGGVEWKSVPSVTCAAAGCCWPRFSRSVRQPPVCVITCATSCPASTHGPRQVSTRPD